MIRLCVIGNSHIGAIRRGWDTVERDYQNSSIDFFGSTGDSIKTLANIDGVLSSPDETVRAMLHRTSGGRESIVPASYDAFVVVGLGLSTDAVANVYRRFRPFTFAKADMRLISRACVAAAVSGLMQASLALQTARLVRSVSMAPIFCIPAPQPSSLIQDEPVADAEWLSERALIDGLYELIMATAARIEAAEGFRFLWQPAETMEMGYYSRREFGLNSVNLFGKPKGDQDQLFHMGPEYGAIVVRALFATLEETLRAQAA